MNRLPRLPRLDPGLILPPVVTNVFPGRRLALWLFVPLMLVTLWRSQHHLLAADGGAQSIAHIPLNAYPEPAAATIVGLFALWGLSQLILAFLQLLVLLRYRSMIPLFYLLSLIEYSVRASYIPAFRPIPTTATAPGAVINVPIAAVSLALLLLSIWPRREVSV
ncbi:putative membrane protein [Synechococcus sp. PROS-7-1]|uniref:hypothetical protein n=1 Tax=Synechococcus sp. PROS-7-1 TaxID=1442556 RepID=UPI00185FC5F2|nr:hypothetical protein [Synechococcus sp. PROS-7-1]QNI84763.1 putative membrane protein [Synechococcus sp. PROS-7-1]